MKSDLLFRKDLNKENVLFLENYVWISNIERIHVENFKKENLTNKIPLEFLSLGDLKIENCILIPRNNLSCIVLELRRMSKIFENEINVANFKHFLSKSKIIIQLSSMDDFVKLNELKEYFPKHSELAISYAPTIK